MIVAVQGSTEARPEFMPWDQSFQEDVNLEKTLTQYLNTAYDALYVAGDVAAPEACSSSGNITPLYRLLDHQRQQQQVQKLRKKIYKTKLKFPWIMLSNKEHLHPSSSGVSLKSLATNNDHNNNNNNNKNNNTMPQKRQ